MIYAPGATSQSIDVAIYDDTGLPVTGLVAATFPATYWSLAGNTAATQISLSDLALITSSYSSGGVKERTGSAGVYRLDLPNAALTNAGAVKVYGDASGKHLVCEPIVVGYVHSNVIQINSSSADGLQPIRTGTAQAGTSSTITLDASASSVNEFYRSRWIRTTGGTGAGQVGLCTSYNGTTKAATIEPNWAVTPDNTTTFAVLGTGPVDVGTIDRTDATTMIGAVWDELAANHTFAGSFGYMLNSGVTLTSAYDFAKGTAAMVESYAADGAAPTPAQAFFMIWSLLAERSKSSTTLTAKKLDGVTTSMTFTLDSASNPTSQTRTG